MRGDLELSREFHWLVPTLHRSVLGDLQPNVLERLLADAMRVDAPAGSVLYREGDPPRCGLLVSGLLRVYLAAADGRQVTIRYMAPGSLSGSSIVALGTPAVARVQAVTDMVGLVLNTTVVQSMASTEPHVAVAIAQDIAHSQEQVMRAFGINVFGTLRQRVVRHLLDLASEQFAPGQRLVAPVTQQQLAEAVASSREAIARVLRDLREAYLVETSRGGVTLLDPARLHAEIDTV